MKEIALKYHSLGLSVVPMGSDKLPRLEDKSEHLYPWKAHQQKLIQPNINFDNAYGIAIVTGKVSGNLELLDIDSKYDLTGTLFPELKVLIKDTAPGLLEKMVVESTPSGGFHFIYRIEGDVAGNHKIANRLTTAEERQETYEKWIGKGKSKEEAEKASVHDKVRVLIETRGEGGYFGVAPSKGYKILYGSLDKISVLTPTEHQIILSCAKSFNQVYEPAKIDKKQEKSYNSNLSPFEDYNQRADIRILIESMGWSLARSRGNKYYYLRPGGEQQWSSEYDDDKRLFYVWTSSSEFDGEKAYNASQVLSILKFGGDYSAAAKWLISEGYGEQTASTTPPPRQQSAPKVTIQKDDDNYDFLAPDHETDSYITAKRTGNFKMGNKTGFTELDKYYRFKDAQLDMVLGHDNAGKSIVSWYFSILDCMYNNQFCIIFAGENKTGGVKCKLMEYYLCKTIEKMNDVEYKKAKAWVENHYAFISNDEAYSYQDMINIGWKMLKKKPYTKFIIEPYNVLDKPANSNDHQYDYKAMLDFRLFIRKSGIGVLLNIHASTEALRKTYPKEHDYFGYSMPPNKSDAEGGGKFPNKADNFLVVHRMADHPTENVWTEIHVQKIKEYETGGQRTFKNEPFKIRMVVGGCGFEDQRGQNPVFDWHEKNTTDIKLELKPNTTFIEEKPIHSLVDKSETVYVKENEEDDQPF